MTDNESGLEQCPFFLWAWWCGCGSWQLKAFLSSWAEEYHSTKTYLRVIQQESCLLQERVRRSILSEQWICSRWHWRVSKLGITIVCTLNLSRWSVNTPSVDNCEVLMITMTQKLGPCMESSLSLPSFPKSKLAAMYHERGAAMENVGKT
jgi:hypothetical protein